MKHTITIFVSGSKRLKEHRMRLKVLAYDMNEEYRNQGYDVNINMYSYMNLGDNQKEYDNFIENKSDIVFFIIEDVIGEKTRDEFLLASKAYKKTGSPKIYVFLKEYKERTPEIDSLEEFINSHSNSYYVEYSNIEDLVSKVRTRLGQDVDYKLNMMNSTPEKRVRKFKLWAIVSTLLLSLFLIGSGIYSFFVKPNDVILLFAGGGSAMSSIKNLYPSIGDIKKYDNAICIGMPSKTAWSLISSEVIHHHATRRETVRIPFFPVVFSAKEAKESDFLNLTESDQFIKRGSVISIHFGDDRLMIYVKKSWNNELTDNKDSITVKDLCKLINTMLESNYSVFSTQEGSGTLLAYRDVLTPLGIDISTKSMGENLKWFSQSTPSNKIRRDGKPYLILGSEFYVNNELCEEGDCRGLVVIDDNNQAISKPAYLYFAAYYHGEEGNSFWIPDEMVDFLKKIDPRYGKYIKNNKFPRKSEIVIVHLDEEISAL